MKKLVTHLKKGGFKPLDLYQRKTPGGFKKWTP
jgi:hypothetical protein